MVKTFHPENRLAKLIKLPGGVTLADAMVRANRNLASVRDVCLAGVDEKISAMEAMISDAPPARAPIWPASIGSPMRFSPRRGPSRRTSLAPRRIRSVS